MITIRSTHDRGAVNIGWLDSRHTFSFGSYSDPNHMGFATLRVINEDKVAPGQGFQTHSHRDMEIVTYVLDGALEHKDSLGTSSIIRPGDVQRMTAGTGITHSEFNSSKTDPVHLLQIWILPDRTNLEPGYEQKNFPQPDRSGKLCLVGSRDGREGSIVIHQNIDFYSTSIQFGERVSHPLAPDRMIWVQVASGTVQLNGEVLVAGDGAAIEQESLITLEATTNDSEVLLFDMAKNR